MLKLIISKQNNLSAFFEISRGGLLVNPSEISSQTTTSNIIVSMAEEIYKQSDLRGDWYHLGGVATGGFS